MSIKKLFRLLWKTECMGCNAASELNRYGFCHLCEKKIVFLENHSGTKEFHILRYEGPVKNAICRFKYNRKTYYGKRFATLAFDFIQKNNLTDFDVLVPVPLHWKKEFMRGFNQSAIVCIQLGRLLNKRCLTGVLVKTKSTVSQTRLNEKERKENVKGTFCIRRAGWIKNKNILLLDDVYTSGSTIKEARKTILAAGASKVTILTLSRAQI
jgi:competence protein ComFC